MPINTNRLSGPPQEKQDSYAIPATIDITVTNHRTHCEGNKRYTDYEVKTRTNLPSFNFTEASVRRRYSDFEWLRNELTHITGISLFSLPSKGLLKQMPFRKDQGIFEESFIEERQKGLEKFIRMISSHPSVQITKIFQAFLCETTIDYAYYENIGEEEL